MKRHRNFPRATVLRSNEHERRALPHVSGGQERPMTESMLLRGQVADRRVFRRDRVKEKDLERF